MEQTVPPIPTVEPTAQPHEKHWLKWILIVVVVALLSSAAFIVLTQTKQQPKPSPTTTTEPTSILDETANWKTYTNSKYGYTIKYPSDLFASCTIQGGENNLFLFDGNENTKDCFTGEEPTQLYIKEYSDTNAFFKTSSDSNCYTVTTEEIILAGTKGMKYTNNIIKDTEECNKTAVLYARGATHIVLPHNDITLDIYTNEVTNKEVKQQILSTFKFTNEQSGKTSPGGMYIVTEEILGDYNTISIKDNKGTIITADLVAQNTKEIGYNTKMRCMCGTNFKAWVDEETFSIKIVNGGDEEYEFLVAAKTGKVDESTFKRIK